MEAQRLTRASPPLEGAARTQFTPVTVLLCLIFGIISVAFIFAFIMVIAVDKERTRHDSQSSYCCPYVASQLIKAANFSLNPCRNYIMYTCYNWPAISGQITSNHSPNAIYASAISGRFGSAVGRAIFEFHRSCLYTVGRGSELPEKAVSALLETTNVSRGMAPLDVLRVLIQLSLLHELYTPVRVDIQFIAHLSASHLFVRSNPFPPLFLSQFIDDKQIMLRTFNEKLRVNIETEELFNLIKKLHISNKMEHEHFAENLEPLDNLVTNVSKHQWLAMAAPFYFVPPPAALSYTDIDHIQEMLHVLATDSSERREAQLALLIIMAGVHLTRNYPEHVPLRESAPLFLYCDDMTGSLLSSWRILTKEELTDSKKDDIVRTLYSKTKNAVILGMQELFDPVDWTAARRVLSSARLILPADLVPRNVSVPVLGEDFYSNLFKTQHHHVEEQKRLVNLGFDFIHHQNEFQTNLKPVGGNAVLMSSMSYYLLTFDEGTDPAINAANVGTQMAIFLWRTLFDSKDWMPATRTRIKEYHDCSTGVLPTSMNQNNLEAYTLLRLSLSSAVGAVRTEGPEWHLPLHVWSTSLLSRAQVFYMKFTATYCPFATDISIRTAINSYLPGIRDFRDAYACPQSGDSATNCSFNF